MTRDELRTFLGEKMGMCGCGLPEEAVKTLRDTLALFEEWSEKREEERNSKLMNGEPVWKVYSKKLDDLLGRETNEGLYYWWLYYLNHVGVLEHGGNVTASWITGEGCAVLEALKQIDDVDAFLDGK